jgi:hypothetical protein
MNLPLVVYVDIDDTLICSFGSKRIPMPHTIDRVRQLHADGSELYCWSSGGGDWSNSIPTRQPPLPHRPSAQG